MGVPQRIVGNKTRVLSCTVRSLAAAKCTGKQEQCFDL